jgi:hypothetical protein
LRRWDQQGLHIYSERR